MTAEVDSHEELLQYILYPDRFGGGLCIGRWEDSDVSGVCTDKYEEKLRELIEDE